MWRLGRSYCLSENVSLKRSELGPQWQSGHEASFSCDSHRRLLLPDYFLAPHKLLSGQHDKAGERPTSLFSHNIFIVPSKFSESRNAKYLTQQICVNGNIQNLSLLTHRYIPYNVLHCTGHRVHPTPKKFCPSPPRSHPQRRSQAARSRGPEKWVRSHKYFSVIFALLFALILALYLAIC